MVPGVCGGTESVIDVQFSVSSQKLPFICRLFLSSASLRLSLSYLAFDAAFLFSCHLFLAMSMQNVCREEVGWVMGLVHLVRFSSLKTLYQWTAFF